MQIPTLERCPPDLLGCWSPEDFVLEPMQHYTKETVTEGVCWVPNLLSSRDCQRLIRQFDMTSKESVGVYGIQKGSGQGSERALGWSIPFSRRLWERFSHCFIGLRYMDDHTPTDWFRTPQRAEYRTWRAIALSPLLRFMKYQKGGEHFGHYDMGYDYGDGRRTLVSFVLFLNDVPSVDGGSLRILKDGQEEVPVSERRFQDWTRRASAKDIAYALQPQEGGVVFFDHRICHDVAPYQGSTSRYVIRGDVVFWAV